MAGEGNQGAQGNQAANGGQGQAETVSKTDFDAKVQEVTKLQQDLEDMRLEVFSPAYMEFLDAKEKGGGKGKEEESKPKAEFSDDDLKNLTPRQLVEKAKELAKAELKEDIEKAKTAAVDTVGKEQRQREVASFARTHEDFETYRPIMYGLSLNPKNKDLSLQELYDLSHEHVKKIHSEPSKEEKERQARMSTEKPGGDNQSYEKYTKMSPNQIAKESLDEVKSKLGPIPQS